VTVSAKATDFLYAYSMPKKDGSRVSNYLHGPKKVIAWDKRELIALKKAKIEVKNDKITGLITNGSLLNFDFIDF